MRDAQSNAARLRRGNKHDRPNDAGHSHCTLSLFPTAWFSKHNLFG
jgi:hypothetical protein